MTFHLTLQLGSTPLLSSSLTGQLVVIIVRFEKKKQIVIIVRDKKQVVIIVIDKQQVIIRGRLKKKT